MTKRIAFIGLGKQNTKDHLKAAQNNLDVSVVAVCDNNKEIAKSWGDKLDIHHYSNIDELLKQESIDAAIVALPHFAYMEVVEKLITAGIHVLKEKPFALTLEEAKSMAALAEKHKVTLSIAVQRKHNKVFQSYQEYAPRIGDLFSIHGEYTLDIDRLDDGWRASKEMAGGGAVIDMGYHLIDLITWYFGLPDRVSADLGYHNRAGQKYDVEDTAKVQFAYLQGERKILGSLILSRIYPEKDEGLFIYGTIGAIKLYKDRIELYDESRELIESKYIKSNGGDIADQFNAFIACIDDPSKTGNFRDHICNMIFIDAIYASDEKSQMIMPNESARYKSYLKLCNAGEANSNENK